jgi:hypothetical protein
MLQGGRWRPCLSRVPRCADYILPDVAPCCLAARHPRHHPAGMFTVTETEATAIRTAFDQGGEFAAAVELRRLFPGVTDNAQARECARTIAGWTPLPVEPVRHRRREPLKRSPEARLGTEPQGT